MSFQNGLFLNFDYKLAKACRNLVKSELKVYENLEEYIGDYTTKSNIQLANLGKIFQYFIYLYLLIISAFVLNQIYKYRRVIRMAYSLPYI